MRTGPGFGNTKTTFGALGLTAIAVSVVTSAANAGEQSVELEWSGHYRVRAESYIDRDLDSDTGGDRSPILQRVRLGLRAKVNDNVSAFAQIQDSRAWGDEASTAADESNLDLHQGYARLSPNDSLDLSIGRQEWNYGDQRLIGAFGWNNVGRAFDGVRVHRTWGEGWVDGFWGRLARFQDSGKDEDNRDLLGLYTHFDLGDHDVEPYLLYYRADDDTASELDGAFDSSNVIALGVRAALQVGKANVTAELTYETGDIGGDDLDALAFAATVKGKFGDAERWLSPIAGIDYASGDSDSGDGERGEFFNFFPTNHLHYGFVDFFGWRNIIGPWGGASFGGNGHAVTIAYHRFWLAEPAGRWSSAGGATLGFDPTGMSGDEVGQELDVTYKKTVFEKVDLHAGYAMFAPGDFAEATRGSDTTHFLYLQAAIGF